MLGSILHSRGWCGVHSVERIRPPSDVVLLLASPSDRAPLNFLRPFQELPAQQATGFGGASAGFRFVEC